MVTQRTSRLSLLAICIATCSSSVFAAGFQLNGQSATGLGRAFAGDAVIADNASVMARNPAAMSLFDSAEISLGLIAIDTDVSVKNATYTAAGGTATAIPDASIGGVSPVPNIFYVHPVNQQITLGAGVYSNFGTKTEFPSNYPAGIFGGLTDLKTTTIGLSGAYQLNQQLSLGFGLDIITGVGKLSRAIPVGNASIPVLDVEATGLNVGWNAGVVYELNDEHRFGFSYRYSPDIHAEFDGQPTYIGQPLAGELKLKLPDIAEFSGYHSLTPEFAVHYSVQWIEWSTFDALTTTAGVELNRYEWKNGWHYSLGGTYNLRPDITLRAGYMYDVSAQNNINSISVPDSDRQWFSAGLSYHWSKQSTFDFGLTYLMGKDVAVNEENALASITATTRANALLYGVQYSYKF